MRFLITWRLVRNLGELQVLTRASYLMLLLVPILAALWPGVRLVINRYNDAVTDATFMLEAASERLEHHAARLERVYAAGTQDDRANPSTERGLEIANTAQDVVSRLRSHVDAFIDKYPARTIEKTALPSTWAFAFFAALAVFFGHLVYQLAAPDDVRQSNIQDFISKQKDEYAKNPSDSALRRAEYHISDASQRGFHIDVPHRPAESPADSPPEVRRRWEMDVIEAASIVQYRVAASRNIPAIVFASTLYLIAISFVLWIVIKQSLAVARAVEWLAGGG